MKNILKILLSLVLACTLFNGVVIACGCIPEPDCLFGDVKKCVRSRFKHTGVIFLGKVVDRDIKEDTKLPESVDSKKLSDPNKTDIVDIVVDQGFVEGRQYIATVEVEIAWKGFQTNRVLIMAKENDGVGCGIDLHIGSSYVFYTGIPERNLFYASICNVGSANDVALLPKGKRIQNNK